MSSESSWMVRVACAGLVSGAVLGCQSQPRPGDPSYRAGELGNGGFLFDCDDTVACERYSGAADRFPSSVALGSTFRVGYVPKDSSVVKDGSSGKGVTVGTVGTAFLSLGPDGLTAVKAGYGSVLARNASGALVDFTSLRVVKPDALVVYDAEDTEETSSPVSKMTLRAGDRKTLRSLARADFEDLAGALRYEWTSGDSAIVEIEGYARGKVTVGARASGKTTLKVEGASFARTVDVEVSP